jgi:hypothetical protein
VSNSNPLPKTYKYGTCPVCGHGMWRNGKCFLFPFHSQEPAQAEVAPGQMVLGQEPQLQLEVQA